MRLARVIVFLVFWGIIFGFYAWIHGSSNSANGRVPPGTKLSISGSLMPISGTQAAGVVKVYRHGKLVTVVHTDDQGNFQVNLPVGSYRFDGFIGTAPGNQSACEPDYESFQNSFDADMAVTIIC